MKQARSLQRMRCFKNLGERRRHTSCVRWMEEEESFKCAMQQVGSRNSEKGAWKHILPATVVF